jgi:hypothetical protein
VKKEVTNWQKSPLDILLNPFNISDGRYLPLLLAKKGLEGQRNAEKACLTWGKRGIMTTDFRKSMKG